jgi:hypothetical protein
MNVKYELKQQKHFSVLLKIDKDTFFMKTMKLYWNNFPNKKKDEWERMNEKVVISL